MRWLTAVAHLQRRALAPCGSSSLGEFFPGRSKEGAAPNRCLTATLSCTPEAPRAPTASPTIHIFDALIGCPVRLRSFFRSFVRSFVRSGQASQPMYD